MQESLTSVTILLILATVAVSWRGFGSPAWRDALIFCPQWILARKEYYRLLTSGFLHADWMHLFFNMLTLYFFAPNLDRVIGPWQLLFIYFASILGGNLLSLFLHRRHQYFALGASGGVCGVVFASIFLFPGGSLYIMPIPIAIPSWLYAIAFLVLSFVGVRSQRGNIGHDAHLGGAIIGLLVTTVLHPRIVEAQPWLYAGVLALTGGMFLYFWKNSLGLPLRSFYGPGSSSPRGGSEPSDAVPQAEVDAILDKVSREGLDGLTPREREILRQASRR